MSETGLHTRPHGKELILAIIRCNEEVDEVVRRFRSLIK